MKFLKTSGIVLREAFAGEADKILTLLVGSHGKLSVFAKGAKRNGSRFIGCSQLLTYSNFNLFRGKNMYHINSCDLIEPFYSLRNDVFKLTYSSHMCEIISDVIYENQPSNTILKLFLNCLYMLTKSNKNPNLILSLFELRIVSELGYMPNLNNCICCESPLDNTFLFSYKQGGLLCTSCSNFDRYAIRISDGTRKAITYIIYSDLDKIFNFDLSEKILCELNLVSKKFLEEKLEKSYTTLDFLKKCKL